MCFFISHKSTKDCLKKDVFCCKLKAMTFDYCVLEQIKKESLMWSFCIFSCDIKAIKEAFVLFIKK